MKWPSWCETKLIKVVKLLPIELKNGLNADTADSSLEAGFPPRTTRIQFKASTPKPIDIKTHPMKPPPQKYPPHNQAQPTIPLGPPSLLPSLPLTPQHHKLLSVSFVRQRAPTDPPPLTPTKKNTKEKEKENYRRKKHAKSQDTRPAPQYSPYAKCLLIVGNLSAGMAVASC